MVAIALAPESKKIVLEQVLKQWTTPELLVIEDLHRKYQSLQPDIHVIEGQAIANFLKDYFVFVDSSGEYLEGSAFSGNTGRKFEELMVDKRNRGIQ